MVKAMAGVEKAGLAKAQHGKEGRHRGSLAEGTAQRERDKDKCSLATKNEKKRESESEICLGARTVEEVSKDTNARGKIQRGAQRAVLGSASRGRQR